MRSKTLELQDYEWLAPYVAEVDAARARFPSSRFDHPHRTWEYAIALQALVETGAQNVLDVGGGNALFAALCASRGLHVTVVDPAAYNERVRAEWTGLPIEYVEQPFEFFDGGQYDAVVSLSVIEHIVDDKAHYRKLLQHARKVVVLTTDFSETGAQFVDGHLRTYTAEKLQELHALERGWRSVHRPVWTSGGKHVYGAYDFAALVVKPYVLEYPPVEITLLSIMRNSEQYFGRYMRQVMQVLRYFKRGRVIVVEGDSTDNTRQLLHDMAAQVESIGCYMTVVRYDTAAPFFSSIDDPVRWRNLENCWNEAFWHLQPSQYVVAVESDLIWSAGTLIACLQGLETTDYDLIAPMLFSAKQYEWFYDINAFVTLEDEHFTNTYPFVPFSVQHIKSRYIPLKTAGGLLAMKYGTAVKGVWRDKCRFHPEPGRLVGADTFLTVYHP